MKMKIKKFESYSEDKPNNYMFFANLENICRMTREILDEMDESLVDNMLNEHDWASDHISKSKESISHVYNWLKSNKGDKGDM
jgi:hypothetical protein